MFIVPCSRFLQSSKVINVFQAAMLTHSHYGDLKIVEARCLGVDDLLPLLFALINWCATKQSLYCTHEWFFSPSYVFGHGRRRINLHVVQATSRPRKPMTDAKMPKIRFIVLSVERSRFDRVEDEAVVETLANDQATEKFSWLLMLRDK